MINTVFRQELLETLESVRKGFNQALSDAQKQERAFDKACRDFQSNMAKHIAASRKKIAKDHPLAKSVDAIQDILQKTNQKWDQDIKSRDKGVNFRAKFNDSLMVFIYGKVKSGKSSLGNYMAWGNTDPTDAIKMNTPKHLQPAYFSEERTDVKSGDAHKEAEKNKQFRVGATEATSSIQGFQLSGLTWVDSPGLHSANQANGDLARQYVEHSDLILYTMKSDSPGRESDIKEILDLYRADKKILILITGSDDTEEDWDDEKDEIIQKIIMKDEERRAKQVAQVRQALEKLPGLAGKSSNIEIIAFSARYAQLHEEQAQEFNDSGMGQLFAKLQQVASEEGVKLKQQVPMRNFGNFMQSFVKDVKSYKDELNGFQKPIQEIQKQLPNKVNTAKQKLENQMVDLVDDKFSSISKEQQKNPEEMKLILLQIAEELQTVYSKELVNTQLSLLQDVLTDLEESIIANVKTGGYFTIPEFSQVVRKDQVMEDFKAGNKKKLAAIGSTAGTAIGMYLGSVIPGLGTWIGSTLGGIAGGMIADRLGSNDQIVTKDVETVIGNNLSTIQSECRKSIRDAIGEHMDEFRTSLIDVAINNVNELTGLIMHEIRFFESSVNNIQSEVNIYLNQ